MSKIFNNKQRNDDFPLFLRYRNSDEIVLELAKPKAEEWINVSLDKFIKANFELYYDDRKFDKLEFLLYAAANKVASNSKRGTANTIYHNSAMMMKFPEQYAVDINENIPDNMILFVYEGGASFSPDIFNSYQSDVPFIYDENRGILPNANCSGYGYLIDMTPFMTQNAVL